MFKDITDEFDAFYDDSVETVGIERSSINLKISKKNNKTKIKSIVKSAETKKVSDCVTVEPVDEFEEISSTLSEKYSTSGEDISKYLIGLKDRALSQKTFNGISTKDLNEIISVDTSESMPWKHVIMQADALYFTSISNKKLRELSTFDFVEEICPVNIDNVKFGLNNTYMNKIEYVLINRRLAVIEDFTFMLYTKLKKIAIEEGSVLTKLGIGAFSHCETLKEIDLTRCELLTYLPSKLLFKSGVKRIKLPDSLDAVAVDAFEGCDIQTIEIGGCTYSKDEFMQLLELNDNKPFWKNFDYEF